MQKNDKLKEQLNIILKKREQLKKTFSELVSNEKAELQVDSNGNLLAKTPNTWDKILKKFGLGKFSNRKVKKYFEDNKVLILELMLEWKESTDGIWKLQQILNKKFGRQAAPNLGQLAYADWMSQLPAAKRDQPITNLILPASHDSAAFKVDYSHLTKGNSFVKKMAFFVKKVPLIGPWIGNIVSSWTKTQQNSIYDQLMSGIRVLDLRVSYDPENKEYYLSHTFCCISLDEGLSQIRKFLSDHPNEPVIIEMSPDHEHRKNTSTYENTNKILTKVQNAIGTYLQPPTDLSQLTLNEMSKNGKRAIFSFFNAAPTADPACMKNVWPKFIASEWLDTSDAATKIRGIEQRLQKTSDASKLLEISATLTPQKNDIVKSVFNRFNPFTSRRDLQSLTEPMNMVCSEKLKSDKEWRKAQIISTDQFEKSPIVETIILINKNKI